MGLCNSTPNNRGIKIFGEGARGEPFAKGSPLLVAQNIQARSASLGDKKVPHYVPFEISDTPKLVFVGGTYAWERIARVVMTGRREILGLQFTVMSFAVAKRYDFRYREK